MSNPKIEEWMLYSPLINYLNGLGFKVVGETRVVNKSPDVIFEIADTRLVIEVEIGKEIKV